MRASVYKKTNGWMFVVPMVSLVSRSTSEAVSPKLASSGYQPNRVYTQADIDFANSFLNPPFKSNEIVKLEVAPEVIVARLGQCHYSESVEIVVTSECPDSLTVTEVQVLEEIVKIDARNDVMIPDPARTFSELSDGISKSNCLPDFVCTVIEDYLDFSDIDNLLHSDNTSLDQDLYYPNSLDDDFYQNALTDDNYIFNLHEDDQEKPNAAAIEAAAFKSSQMWISPELCNIVNPNEIYPFQVKNEVVEIKVTDDVMVNNPPKVVEDGKVYKYVFIKKGVHNDHAYFKEEGVDESVVVKTEIKQEPMSDDEYDYEVPVIAQNVMKVEAPRVIKRPVGRPRKVPIVTKPVKRSADHFDDENNEEFVDVESIEVKRPRKARGKSGGKKLTIQKQRKSLPVTNPTHFQEIDPFFNPNGYVMRQAKTSAMKKITKTTKKTGQAVSRSKRSDHNDMERRRRHEMRDLFEQLKKLVPTELLVDDNNKIKKNPSKNTCLNGTYEYILILHGIKTQKNSLIKQNQKLMKKHRRLAKRIRKQSREVMSRS